MQGAMTQAGNLSNLGFNNQYGNLSGYAGIIGNPTTTGNKSGATSPGLLGGFGSFANNMKGGGLPLG